MVDLTAAFYDRMVNDSELAALLATYPVGTVSTADSGIPVPAIFTDQQVPEDAELPYIWTYGQIGNAPDDTKLQPGRDILRDIRCYTKRNETSLVEQIGFRVRELFHRHALTLNDAVTIVAEASGPSAAPTDEQIIGRVVTVRLRYEDR